LINLDARNALQINHSTTKFNFDISIFWSQPRILGFATLSKLCEHSSYTQANKMTYISRFLRWIKGKSAYRNHSESIQTIINEDLNRIKNQSKKMFGNSRQLSKFSPRTAYEEGHFLKKNELEYLWNNLLKKLLELTKDYV
jgi:hypothetical protein